MAVNNTDETVDFNSENNSQGPTNPKDRRTGYSSVNELLNATWNNTMKKSGTPLKNIFDKAKAAGQIAEQKVQPAPSKFTMKDIETAAMADKKPITETPVKQPELKKLIFNNKPVKPQLIREEKPIPTLEEFQDKAAQDVYKFRSETTPVVKIPSQPEKNNTNIDIAIENTMRLFDSQLNKDAPNRDFTISNVKNNIYNGLNNGDLRVVSNEEGYPVVKNVIDGVLNNVIEGYRQTAIQDREHETYFSLNKKQQIARLKGYNLKPMETVGEVGKLYPEKYTQSPIDPYMGAIETEKTGFAPDIAAGIGQVGYDVRYSIPRPIPVVGNSLSAILSSIEYGKRQMMDGISSSFNQAVQSGLTDDEAWEVANSTYNKTLSAVTGAAEGYTSQLVNRSVFKSFSAPVGAKSLRTFGQAMSAFVKDAAANSKEAIGSAAIDAATAWSMEKLRGGSDDAANEQGKMEFLVNMALVGLGGGFRAPKYIKSYAYNAISNVPPQDIYTKGVELEQQGFIPEGTSKTIVNNVEKFKKIKDGLVNVREENIPAVAGLLMKKESLLESQKTSDSTNTQLQQQINNELNIVNEKITEATNAKNPLTVEYDDKTGINLKYNENAITEDQAKQQESATASNISEYQRTEGVQTQTPYESNSSYSDFGSKTKGIKFPGTVYIDATNASNYTITAPETPRDFMINSANKIIASLASINPGLKVVVFDNSIEYGNALVERELGPGTVNNQRAAELKGSNGAYDKSNNTIYINGEQLNKNGKTTTLFHEGTHPIINAIASSSPEAVDNLYNQLNKLSEDMANMQKSGEMDNGLEISDSIDEVLNWADRVYKSQDDNTKKSEAIVEFIARVSDGSIKLPQENPVVMKSIIDVIKGFLDIIGMPVDIRTFSDIENIASKIKEGFQTGQRIEVSTVKNKNGEITLYKDSVENGEPGTTVASGVVNPEFFNTDGMQTDLFQPVGVKWDAFESDGSFDMITPANAVRMYDALNKSGGALVVTNSDATGIGLSKRGNLRQGGIGFTFIEENLNNEIGFAASDDSKIPSFFKAIVDAKNKRDAAYPSQAGKPVATFVMVQSPTAMFGNAYGADYFADALEYVTRNKAISTRKAKAELIDFISNFTKANETGRKYESSFAALVDVIKRYDMSTEEGKAAIDALLITNKESNRDTSNRFGFDARRYFLSNFFAGEGSISSKAPASNLRNALKESGFYIKDFIDEYGDENVVNNLSGKNNTEMYMKDGGFAMTGFFVDPYMSEEEFIAKSKNQTFAHRQFNSGFHGIDPFILDGKYYVNEAFPEASFVSNKPGSLGKEIPVATSAAGSMYPRTQKNQEAVVNRFALQGEEGKTRKSAKQTDKENARTEADAAASFAYNTNAKVRAKNLQENNSLLKSISNKYQQIKLKGTENQSDIIKVFKQNGATSAVAEAMLSTSRGFGAQVSVISEDVNEMVYGGLSDKPTIDVFGTKVSEVELLNQLINARRIVAVQEMVQDKFDELQAMRAKMKKLRSQAKKDALQVKIDAAVEYLEDRKVLGKKYNPNTKETTEYLQNYQVGSTVDANGNKVADNAGMASKRIELIKNLFSETEGLFAGGFEDMNRRADVMYNSFRVLMKEKLDNGLTSKEEHDFYTKYDYVPITYINKILESEDPSYARVLAKNPNQLRKAVLSGGADGDILTDYDAVFKVFASGHYRSIANNRAAVSLADFAEQSPNNGVFEVARPVIDDDGDIVLDKDGNPVYPTAPKGKSYIFFYQDGQRKAILADEEMEKQWNKSYGDSETLNTIARWSLASFAQKVFTGKNPAFGIFQMIGLDPITAAVATDVFSPSVPVAYAQIALGGVDNVGWKGSMQQVVKRGDKYRLAAKWGAFTEMSAGKELESSVKDPAWVEKIGEKIDKIPFVGRAISEASKISDVTEKATRLIIFDRARVVFSEKFEKDNGRKPNATELEKIYAMAAHEARRSSDFARGGDMVKGLSKVLLYLNSSVRTSVSVIDQAKKNPLRAMYQVAELLGIGGLAVAYSSGVINASWEDEEERKKKKIAWESLSPYQKTNYINVYIGGDNPETMFVKIPIAPFYKNFWAAGMMQFEEQNGGAKYDNIEYIKMLASANSFGDVTEAPAKLAPLPAAFLAYNNLDLFSKKEIVSNEKRTVDEIEGAANENISQFYKSLGQMTGLSPARTQAAGQKFYGQPERNPFVNLSKLAFELPLRAIVGAPLVSDSKKQDNLAMASLKAMSLDKRFFAGTSNYYKTQILANAEEISFLQSKAYAAVLANDSETYKKSNDAMKKPWDNIKKYASMVKKDYPELYSNIVKVSINKLGSIKYDLSPNVTKDMKDRYIRKNFEKNIYDAYNITNPKEKALYVRRQVKSMDKKEAMDYIQILFKLGIMNNSNAAGIEYEKLRQAENK